MTAVFLAVSKGNLEILKYLLANDHIDINFINIFIIFFFQYFQQFLI